MEWPTSGMLILAGFAVGLPLAVRLIAELGDWLEAWSERSNSWFARALKEENKRSASPSGEQP